MAIAGAKIDNSKTAKGPSILSMLKTADIQFALALIAVIFVMVLPLPPIIIDVLLSVSITLAFFILLVSIYVKEPLEFSTFPTLLLLTTLFRLALNVATTRNILLNGATGEVSTIVKSFGQFVVGGNYIVGFVIFTILIIINFIVITKGAGRIAEVGARFTLDAMPGKQMAIDAELSSGLIDRDEARRRRSKIEREADFYGAMDGASKFVRGDAIAAIIITIINIAVGLLLGVLQYNLSFSNSAQVFALLTVGDGLVSQIPALIISTAAGLVVTRAGGTTGLSQELSSQMIVHPKAMFVSSGLVFSMALVPGLPATPFLLMAAGFYFLGRYSSGVIRKRASDLQKESEIKARTEKGGESITTLLHVDALALEVGVGLIPLVDVQQNGEVLDRIVSARKQFAQDLGIIVPMVMVRDNIQLKPGEYQILLKGNSIGQGNLMVDYYLAMDPGDISEPMNGIKTKEPAYGLDAIWIKPSQRDEATFRGYTVVNSATVIVTHLTKLIQENAHELLGRQEVQNLIDGIKSDFPKVVEEVIATDRLTLGDVVKVLQNLLAEGVSIRDLVTVFETLADYCKSVRHPDALTRYVRKSLGRGITKKYLAQDNVIVVTSLDRAVEDLLLSGLQQNEDGSTSLNIDPEIAQRLLNNIATTMKNFETTGTIPILLCGSRLRWDLRKILHRFIPGIITLAFDEIPSDVKTQNIGIVTI